MKKRTKQTVIISVIVVSLVAISTGLYTYNVAKPEQHEKVVKAQPEKTIRIVYDSQNSKDVQYYEKVKAESHKTLEEIRNLQASSRNTKVSKETLKESQQKLEKIKRLKLKTNQ